MLSSLLFPQMSPSEAERWRAAAGCRPAKEGAKIPLTLALVKPGAGCGSAFAFLLSSVGTCLPTIAMAGRIIGAAATALYVVAWLALSIGGGLLMEMFLR
jgi:uncharacterized membrane protein YraQ (UPF0718 family)